MFQLKLEFPTLESLQDAVQRLTGNDNQYSLPLSVVQCGGVASTATPTPKATTKAAEKKAAVASATNEGMEAPKVPAAVKKAGRPAKTTTTNYTLQQLKDYVLTFVDASEGDKIKEFARSRGVSKYSDLSESQIQEAYAAAETFFSGSDVVTVEEDVMD